MSSFTEDEPIELELLSSFTEDESIELELLRDQEIDALVDQKFLPADEQWNPELRSGFVFLYPEVIVEIVTGHPYPAGPLEYQVKNQTMPRLIVDKLKSALYEILQNDGKANNLEKWANRGHLNNFGCFEFEMTVLHIAAKTAEHLADYRNSQQATKASREFGNLNTSYGVASDDQGNRIDLSTIQGHGSVTSLLGKTPEEICAEVPEHFRILHIESVIRGDLYSDFLYQKGAIRKQLLQRPLSNLMESAPMHFRQSLRKDMESRVSLVDHLVTPQLTFHGTRRDYVPSIVQHGFLLPGDPVPHSNEEHQVRYGSTHGRGIYSSPSPGFSLTYSGPGAFATNPKEYDGLKLIVCATIMGISATLGSDENWRKQSKPLPGANSHVSPNRYEYIVFNRAQILPCYVIHLDWGRDNARFFQDIPVNPQIWINRQKAHAQKKLNPQTLAPGDIQRFKEAQMSKAAKWFPYGYGPAKGTSFIIEEIGDVDEDEEEYGMYQIDRVDKVEDNSNGGENFWVWGNLPEDGDNRTDEYYHSRRAKRERING